MFFDTFYETPAGRFRGVFDVAAPGAEGCFSEEERCPEAFQALPGRCLIAFRIVFGGFFPDVFHARFSRLSRCFRAVFM
jgi:hypothetical protein